MKKRYALPLLLLCTCILTALLLISVAPILARLENSSIWHGRIAETTEADTAEAATTPDLLVEGGQIVLLGVVEESIEIALPNLEGGTVNVVVSPEGWAEATLTDDGKLKIERRTPSQDNEEETTEPTTTADETTEEPTELTKPTAETTEEPTETIEPIESTTKSVQDAEPTEPSTPKKDPNTEEGGTEETTTDAPDETEGEEPDTGAKPDAVKITVTWTSNEDPATVRSATFVLSSEESKATGSVVFAQNLQYYSPNVPIIVSAEEDACTLTLNDGLDNTENSGQNDGKFPQWTRYKVKGETYLLYTADRIYLPSDTTAAIDLSLTDLKQDIKIGDASGSTEEAADNGRMLTYCELPLLTSRETPLIMSGDSLALEKFDQWGLEGTPKATVERLERTEEGTAWVEEEAIFCALDAEETKETEEAAETSPKTLYLRAKEGEKPAAGTYRVTLCWMDENDQDDPQELYSLDIPFYLFYERTSEEQAKTSG